METRKITIISESDNQIKVVETGAETLGELKSALSEAGISYEDKTFREGLTRTELIDNGSKLPKDVMYKGNVTNNLVFTLTTVNKKIKSGAPSRSEVYALIKNNNLATAVLDHFGRNFTQISTEALVSFLNDTFNAMREADEYCSNQSEQNLLQSMIQTLHAVVEAHNNLVSALWSIDHLEDSQADSLMVGNMDSEALSNAAPEAVNNNCPYSVEELNNLRC